MLRNYVLLIVGVYLVSCSGETSVSRDNQTYKIMFDVKFLGPSNHQSFKINGAEKLDGRAIPPFEIEMNSSESVTWEIENYARSYTLGGAILSEDPSPFEITIKQNGENAEFHEGRGTKHGTFSPE